MALIDITVDNPSLISTGESQQRPTEGDSEAGEESASEGDGMTGETDDTVETISTLLTAATTVAGVLKELRSEDEVTESAEGLADDEGVTATEEEAETFVESVGEETADEGAVDEGETEESEVDESEEAEDSPGTSLLAAFVLVVILVAVVLWTRDDEEAADDDWD